jgi:hypothetical protein
MQSILWDRLDPSVDCGEVLRQNCESLFGMTITHIWRGIGASIFVEFGKLLPGGFRRDGSSMNPHGEWSLMLEWSWRIEGKRRIWCGSLGDEARWPRVFAKLVDSSVVSLNLTGRLPEIDVGLSNGLHFVSMMTTEGDPEWGLINRTGPLVESFGIEAGRLLRKTEPNSLAEELPV